MPARRSATCAEIAGATTRASKPVLRLDHGDAAAAERKRRGDFQPDEAAAEDHDILDLGAELADGAGVGDRAQRQHAAKRSAFDRQLARPRAGGQDGPVEGDMPPPASFKPLAGEVDAFDALARA